VPWSTLCSPAHDVMSIPTMRPYVAPLMMEGTKSP